MLPIWKFLLDRRSFTWLLMAALSVAGVVAAIVIPKENAPEVEIPIGIVSVVLPGASAVDTERLLTIPLEDEIANVENISKLTSSSGDGVAVITAEFNASADIDKAISDLKEAVDRAKPLLPEEAKEPTVSRVNFSDQPIILLSIAADMTAPELVALSDELERELRGVSGVSKITASGVRAREVSVVVRGEALSQYGLTLSDVTRAIAAQNASLPVGSITTSGIDYAVRFEGTIQDPAEVESLPIIAPSGNVILLRDVATVVNGLEETRSLSRISIEGEPSEQAITLSVYKKSGGDITQVSRDVVAKLTSLEDTTLKGSAYVVTYDAGKEVGRELGELSRVGFETVLLVMASLLIAIGWRESLAAGLSIPLSFVIAFIGLAASGNTINFVSLFALILAMGILVDSGIVVAEAINARMHRGMGRYDAAIQSLKEYAWPLIAGTTTTIAAFAPLFFISGVTGEFIASIPFTIIFVLIASIIVALGFVPIIALALPQGAPNKLELKQDAYTQQFTSWYEEKLRAFLRDRKQHKRFFIGLAAAFVIALILPMAGLLKVEFFPGGETELMIVELEAPQGTPLRENDLLVRAAEEELYDVDDIASFVTTVGGGSAFVSGGTGGSLANITINLEENRSQSSADIAADIRTRLSNIPGLEFHLTESTDGPPTGAPITVKMFGEDLDALDQASNAVELVLGRIQGTRDVTSSSADDGTEFVFTIDKIKAAELGITPLEVAQALRIAVTGATATTIKASGDDIDVSVRMALNSDFIEPGDANVGTIDDVLQTSVATRKGSVLLGSILTRSLEKSRANIAREERVRVATVQAYVVQGANAIEITNKLKAEMKAEELPEQVRIAYGGENEDVDRSFLEMGLSLLAGLVLMLGILVLQFNSIRYTLYLLSIIPLSLIGVLGGLALTGQALSFPSMLGVIALSGIIINHAIILLDSMYHLIAKQGERTLEDVVVEAASVRLRPIVLTTVTTVVGMIPLSLVSSMWGPLAVSVMFGLTFAMVLTLVYIPLLFYRFPGKRKV